MHLFYFILFVGLNPPPPAAKSKDKLWHNENRPLWAVFVLYETVKALIQRRFRLFIVSVLMSGPVAERLLNRLIQPSYRKPAANARKNRPPSIKPAARPGDRKRRVYKNRPPL